MSVNINLVDKRTPKDSRTEKIKKIKNTSFAILAITAFLAIVIFALDYRFSASYVQKQQADLLNELSKYDETSAKIFIVNSKLTNISKLLNERKKFNTTTSRVAGAASAITVEEYLIDENGINLIISANSLSTLDNFLNSLLSLLGEGVLKGVRMENLTFDSTNYVVELYIL